mgnify:CR=1 FL=1
MLKIYLDWNAITHCKKGDIYEVILHAAEECGDKYIFPYSNAHIRDLKTNPHIDKTYFYEDIEILKAVCGKHFLAFENNRITPMFGYPEDYLDEYGDLIEIIQNTDFLSPEIYEYFKDKIKKSLPKEVQQRIQGEKPEKVIFTIDSYISSQTNFRSLQDLMTAYVPNLGGLINLEAQFKSVCLGLDLFGFRPEKRGKKFTNIDTDASHVFYAAHCDYFVTADKKLRDNAKAMYSYYGYQTKVISPLDLQTIIKEDLPKEYSLDYALSCIEQYGVPRMEADGAHYTLMRNPVFGIFNVCHKIDSYWGYNGSKKCGIYRYCFQNTPYLFYSELENFLNLFEAIVPEEFKEQYKLEYVNPMLSRNTECTSKAKFDIYCTDLDIQISLLSDPMTGFPCPMMQIIVRE